jgi:general secretion pathway protein G
MSGASEAQCRKAAAINNASPIARSDQKITMSGRRGFTLIELMVSVFIIAILVGLAIPLAKNSVKRQKEFELRQALRDMRTAIDKYKDASDRGFIQMKVDTNGYPDTLQVLVDGVQMVGTVDKKLKFLRRIPIDPMTNSKDWGLRSDQDDPKMNSWDGHDVFDIYTKSEGTAFDGTKYKEW